ncbi:T9SS type A sorting domain-containing protein [Seonamhaeicola sediminis]|uniref:T9SS type A sorting domain-containing protein n=1 Tax=Seonamhaeicola sediminis TaxID=2528206 RepID=A0A562YIQ1_9FLAO|nr:T9SS type A sorting domain-containing protein [Seonamhaeicola sediminis]TWO34577.1 T9SS type A sorting domain-containing protein [Seonamhaeicola sediminis]
MKKNTFKSILLFSFALFSVCLIAQTAPDEDTNPDLSCPASGEFENNSTRNVDITNPVNVGTVDDRSCYSDYSERDVYGKTWGVYNITDGSNHWDAPNTLQPRIERSLPRSQETGVGSYARFTGTFRILEAGYTGIESQDGSYIAQAKGKHTGGGGPPDPAICLYLAKPIFGTGANAGKQVAFKIFAERILERGGSGSGREVVELIEVDKDAEITFELEVGFREDPNDATKKIHYCDAVIDGVSFPWNIPDPERGTESGIRYGAYRVKGGRAQIRWANTTYQKMEVVDTGDPVPSDDIYRLRNVATGKFLTAVGNSATPVTMTDSGEPFNTHWKFVESGAYHNIDSQDKGNNIDVLRAVGTDPFLVVSTGKDAPTTDTDKSWTIHYDELEDTYRFESRFSGRILYHEADGGVYHKLNVLETDDRGSWEAIPTSQSLSISDIDLKVSSMKIYPNPTTDSFTIAFKNISGVKRIEVFNILGKVVYKNSTGAENIEVNNRGRLNTGIYLVRAVTDENNVFHPKLVVK